MSIPYEGPDIEFSETFTKLIQEKSVNIFNRQVQDIWRLLKEDIEFQRNPARMSSMLFQRAKDLERGLSSIDEFQNKISRTY